MPTSLKSYAAIVMLSLFGLVGEVFAQGGGWPEGVDVVKVGERTLVAGKDWSVEAKEVEWDGERVVAKGACVYVSESLNMRFETERVVIKGDEVEFGPWRSGFHRVNEIRDQFKDKR